MIDFTSKLGEINDIEHNKSSKIYPQNQVILDCIMPSIPLKHKCLSISLIWVIFQQELSIIDFTLNYPPIRNNLTSASLLSMLIETDYLKLSTTQKQSYICKSAIYDH